MNNMIMISKFYVNYFNVHREIYNVPVNDLQTKFLIIILKNSNELMDSRVVLIKLKVLINLTPCFSSQVVKKK